MLARLVQSRSECEAGTEGLALLQEGHYQVNRQYISYEKLRQARWQRVMRQSGEDSYTAAYDSL